MTEYSRIAKGSVVTGFNGGTGPIVLPFIPDRVEFINYDAMASASEGNVTKAYWDVTMGQGAAAYDTYITGPVYSTAITEVGGISTFKAGLSLQYGPKKQVVSTTKGATTVIEVINHGYQNGDVVILQGLYQTSTTGMVQFNGIPFLIEVSDANTFVIEWNTLGSAFTNLSGSPAGATVMKVLYPYLYFPQVSFIYSIDSEGPNQILISTTTPHTYQVGQQVAFRIPAAYGTVELNSLPNAELPGSPNYYYISQVSDAFNFIVEGDISALTPFNVNIPVTSAQGLNFPQVLAVGDVNSGGFPYTGGPLYPPAFYIGESSNVSTINGPAIQGAFVNNTSQGFMIGNVVAPTSGQTIYWQAYLDDFVSP